MTEVKYDPPQLPPPPDKEVIARAFNRMTEIETPQHRYVRQQWEVTMASVKVAMDAWRRIYPEWVSDHVSPVNEPMIKGIMGSLESAFLDLDRLAPEMTTEELDMAQKGVIDKSEQDRMFGDADDET